MWYLNNNNSFKLLISSCDKVMWVKTTLTIIIYYYKYKVRVKIIEMAKAP